MAEVQNASLSQSTDGCGFCCIIHVRRENCSNSKERQSLEPNCDTWLEGRQKPELKTVEEAAHPARQLLICIGV